MTLTEPAGYEVGRGKSAEFSVPAGTGGGAVENTCGTVCGHAAGALSAYSTSAHVLRVNELSVGACLYRLFVFCPRGKTTKRNVWRTPK